MNNKITLERFLEVGGQIEIRLYPDFIRFGVSTFFAANSLDSARNMVKTITRVEKVICSNTGLKIDRMIEDVGFRWHGISYKPTFDWNAFQRFILFDSIVHNISLKGDVEIQKLYLKAECKVYGNW